MAEAERLANQGIEAIKPGDKLQAGVGDGFARGEERFAEEFVKDHPEGPDIGALIDRLAACLLGAM